MEKLTLLPYELPGKIYRSPMPFSSMFDIDREIFPLYQQAGIKHVVMLPPGDEALHHTGMDLHQFYLEASLQVIVCQVEDFTAPPQGTFDAAIQKVIELAKKGESIAIHCHAGVGRTGMFAACLARELKDIGAEEAIAWVRRFIPNAIDTDYQEQFVRKYKELKANSSNLK